MANYWVVGAMFGGHDDALETFIKRGYWYCWERSSSSDPEPAVKRQQDKFREIKVGDRLAIKKMLGQGSKEIEIRAIGIAKDVDITEWRVYVEWLPILESGDVRRVPINGCAASIHGPFEEADAWTQRVFHV